MIVKVGEDFFEVPQKYSLKFRDKKHLFDMLDDIRQYLVEVWSHSPSDIDYGYEFICNAIEDDNYDSQFINHCIVDYINRGNDSVCTLETFVREIYFTDRCLIIFDGTIKLIYHNLLELYNDEKEPFEDEFLAEEAVKFFIEQVLLEITALTKSDYYYTVEEIVALYSHLVYNEFYEKGQKANLNIATIRNLISKLKKNPRYKDSILNINGKNYVGKEVRVYIEQNSSVVKKIYRNSRLTRFNNDCQKAYELVAKQRNYIADSYQSQLSLEHKKVNVKWTKFLDNYSYRRIFLLVEINVVLLILDDILDSLNFEILIEEFQKYEMSFWNRYKDQLTHYQRDDFQKLYYSILSFVFLYVHRIRMGAMPYTWFKQLGNVNADIQTYINKARKSFKGTKNKAVFSKLFKKFYIACRGDYEKFLSSQDDWKNIKLFIKEHLKAEKNSFEYGQIEENLVYSDTKMRKFSQRLVEYFNDKIAIAEKKISSLNTNKEELNVVSWLGFPPDEDIDLYKEAYIETFLNKKHNLWKIKDGRFIQIPSDELPEIKYKCHRLFDESIYEYRALQKNALIEKGTIYFYDLDGWCGRYKLFPNVTCPKINVEKRYGRFEYHVMEEVLELTGNGMDSILGKKICIKHFMDLQPFEKTKKLPYSEQLGTTVWFKFKKINGVDT